MAVRLFVGNLSYSTTEADLRTYFGAVAPPSQVVLPVDRETGRPRGFAFIEFIDRSHAETAIQRFNGQVFNGRPLAVSEARAREDRGPGGGPGGPRPGGPGGPPPGPGARDRSANFGPPAPPRRLRGKKTTQQDHKPRGPIKERTGGRIYDVDDLEDDSAVEIDDLATKADDSLDDQDEE